MVISISHQGPLVRSYHKRDKVESVTLHEYALAEKKKSSVFAMSFRWLH